MTERELLTEREELIQGLAHASSLIDQERERLGVGPLDPEPVDPRYQAAADQWLVWLHRYEEIEKAIPAWNEQSDDASHSLMRKTPPEQKSFMPSSVRFS